jgi:hypothetical protein
MRAKKKRELSNTQVGFARGVCVFVGGVLIFVGVMLVADARSSVPVEVSWAAQAIGGGMTLFGVLAPREWCVRTAEFILSHIF